MFDQLSERLQTVFSGWSGKTQLTEENMEDALREIRRALLEADVSLRVIKAFLSRIKDRAIGEDVLKSIDPEQQMVKVVHDEMVTLLGGETKPLFGAEEPIPGKPSILVLFGLQGSGKTTSAGKLASKLKKEGKRPFLVAADVYRPAAIKQLMVLGEQVGVPVFTIDGSTDVLSIVHSGLAKATEDNHDIVLVDTAGRLQIDTGMMAELLLLERTLQPQEKLLVVDSMTGQEAVSVAEAFNAQLDVTGLILTKLDGDSRGGAALSIVEATGKPIKFLGVSEKLSGLETFHPERMATRILGMGDVLSLVEKAQEAFDLEEARRMEAKMRKSEFSLDDFLKLQGQLKMLGSLDQILGMLPIPGLNKEMREMISSTGESQMKKVEIIIRSLTADERHNPKLLLSGASAASRVRRIAKGCGQKEEDISTFLKQFEQMRMMMTQFSKMMGGGASDDLETEDSPAGTGGHTHSGAMRGLKMPRSNRKKNKKESSEMDSMLDGLSPQQKQAYASMMKKQELNSKFGGKQSNPLAGSMPKMPGGWPFGGGKG